MRQLLGKEIRLALHPTNLIFLSLSALLLVPDYPYYVVFFYTTLGLFFVCLTGRENHDIEYGLMLPVQKRSLVRGRVAFSVLIELAQLLLAVPFAILRGAISPAPNAVGIEANVAFFGFSLLLMGLYNLAFFPRYYRNPSRVGRAYLWGSVVFSLVMIVLELLTHVQPFFRDRLDTPDPLYLGAKLAVLGLGAAAYLLLTWIAYRVSARRFETLDL
ncbi:MAG: hypothetical protein GX418_06405 [Clostridiales bacterium]|nr:hypothetical protein [Clostridiales bacterium]